MRGFQLMLQLGPRERCEEQAAGVVDVWAELRPSEPGYTEDTDINAMLLEDNHKEKKVRLDRVLLLETKACAAAGNASPPLSPSAVELLGVRPFNRQHEHQHDHTASPHNGKPLCVS